jgi:outer membrane protein OmpA-like peptidoglycan-associated protein
MFMKKSIWLASVTLLLSAGAARAGEPAAQYKPEDVVRAYSDGAGAQCAPGTVASPDGGCDPLVNTRGFSLAAPAGAKPAVRPSAQTAPQAAAAKAAGPARSVYKASAPLTSRAKPGDLLITFTLGSAELTPQAKANARAFATALNSPALAGYRFAIEGHADASGSPTRNEALSETRAQAVKSFLVAEGVAAERLEAKGYGAERLADPRHPESAVNRRVEGLRLN